MEYRIERDTMGEVRVPADKYWGAQTERSLENFKIGGKMPCEIIMAFALLKKAAALTNEALEMLDKDRARLIASVCDEILDGKLEGNFPLVVYQTGSGTQSNMNVNEVIANRGNEIAGEKLLHPNDHVNKSQSSNDTFPTAMHIAACLILRDVLFPAMDRMAETLYRLEQENADVIKTGRTHLQDAVPITLGQEISGWSSMLAHSRQMLEMSMKGMKELALGGTAVGTGLNSHKDFGKKAAGKIGELTGIDFVTAENKFHSLSSKDAMVFSHGALKALAVDMMKIANDVRWLASGPRCGLGEIFIPSNEPGSSIMPGKVNPTQCEAVTMVSVRVMGNDTVMGIAASQGNFELNVFMPVMISAYIESASLLASSMESFNKNCMAGLKPNLERLKENSRKSLMLVTALNPYIGYEKAAMVAKYAYENDISLPEAGIKLGFFDELQYSKWVDPQKLTGPLQQ
ncbi:MAG: class II fumarate hydratase [Sedimentibacter sp.]|uniref:class II fumarate hydratase n=1 Tax=Sedimentibacter sp. TaxID=1960295 RepID=UPI002982859B|nr:class II fumarate hydratase [Sedimentibacter sp.]MDW5299177.1 class II fumarate hydratase [Sedimentibacter sp.]